MRIADVVWRLCRFDGEFMALLRRYDGVAIGPGLAEYWYRAVEGSDCCHCMSGGTGERSCATAVRVLFHCSVEERSGLIDEIRRLLVDDIGVTELGEGICDEIGSLEPWIRFGGYDIEEDYAEVPMVEIIMVDGVGWQRGRFLEWWQGWHMPVICTGYEMINLWRSFVPSQVTGKMYRVMFADEETDGDEERSEWIEIGGRTSCRVLTFNIGTDIRYGSIDDGRIFGEMYDEMLSTRFAFVDNGVYE